MKIELRDITFRYEQVPILNHMDVKFEGNSFSSLLGKSGSGKTSLLKIIAGTITHFTGQVYFDDEEVTKLPPGARNIGWVPQDQLLFPGINVEKNIAFGLSSKKVPRSEQNKRTVEIGKLVGIEHLLKRFPSQLSGGEKQRVALGRAIAPYPELLLLDEPFSSLDAPEREKMALIFKEIQMAIFYMLSIIL